MEEGYKTIIKLLPDIFYRIDSNGVFTYINDSVAVIGYGPDELLGRHYSTILHPEDRDRVQREKMLELYRGKKTTREETPKFFDERRTGMRATRNLEVRLVAKNWNGASSSGVVYGRIISVGVYEGVEATDGKTFLGTLGMIRDITGLKKSEEALMRSEKHYRSLIENSTDVITIIASDGTILFEGPSIKRVLGYDPIDRIGESLIRYAHEEDRDSFEKSFFKNNDNTDNKKEIFYHECRIQHDDGAWMYFEFRGKRIFDDDGIIMCIILNSRDITELKKKEKECYTHLSQTQAIINTATDAIMVFDDNGDILEANPEAVAMYGYSRDELISMNCYDIANARDIFDSFKAAIHETGSFECETVHVHKDRSTFNVDVRGRRIFYNDNSNYLAVIRNITPQKTAEETLRQSF